MDINNNSNITSSVISSISKLKLNSAKRAFEAPKEENEGQKTQSIQEIKNEDVSLIDKKEIAKNPIDIADIQKYADCMGEKLSIDDINYGLMYGRSVIADFSA